MNIESVLKIKSKLPLHSRIIIHLMMANNLINEKISEALKPFDVSIQQFNVLRILRRQKGKPANLFTIQERMISKMSNTTRLVDKLISKGLVKRSVCKTNRRKVEIYITEEGISSLEKMDQAVDNAEKNILNNMSDKELAQLNLLLNKF